MDGKKDFSWSIIKIHSIVGSIKTNELGERTRFNLLTLFKVFGGGPS